MGGVGAGLTLQEGGHGGAGQGARVNLKKRVVDSERAKSKGSNVRSQARFML
jgi:hypothetical protein